jgi:hypothetical protein
VSAEAMLLTLKLLANTLVDEVEVNGKACRRNVDESVVDDVKVGVDAPGHNSTKVLKIVSSSFQYSEMGSMM